MNPSDVLDYLKNSPEFFETYAEEVAQIAIPHPYGGRTISLSERQMMSLREQNRTLESHLHEMIRHGEDNDERGEKMHRLAVALMAATTYPSILHILNFHLKGDFAIPFVSVHLWRTPEAEEAPVLAQSSLTVAVENLLQPYCGEASALETTLGMPFEDVQVLFGEAGSKIASLALIALRNSGGAIGVIALGSEDNERFYPDMGTLYLERLGEMTSATLIRMTR